MTSILNKLTPQKFQTLVPKMIELKIDTQSKLECVVDLIFEKAIREPGFSAVYASLCRVLTDAVSILSCIFLASHASWLL